MVRKLIKVVGVGAAVLIAVIGIILIVLFMEHDQPVTLPALTGPYAVGRAAFDWVDESRPEVLAPETALKRELTVWIWYPALIEKGARSSDYEPRPWRVALAQHQGFVMTDLLRHNSALVHTRSFVNPQLAPSQPAYPVILMKPGIGALALDYSTLAEDLASEGYIVVASDSPYSTYLVVFENGRVAERRPEGNPGENAPVSLKNQVANRAISTWVSDDRFLLDRLSQLNGSPGIFRRRLNLHAVGVMGHSFGGATAAEFCREDPRCTAGIDIDGIPFGQVVHTSLQRPFMFLMSDHSREQRDAESQDVKEEIQSIYERLPPGRLLVILRNAGHFSFSDNPLIFNPIIVRMSGAAGSISPTRGLNAAAACIRAFFDVHLKGAPASELLRLRTDYPQLMFADDSKPVAAQM